jgi:CheY-like chemotaxis protein
LVTVLLVEDDPAFIYLIQRYADKGGCRLVSTARGDEALELARREWPVLILLDIMLPGMDGWQVLRELKADASTSGIPVVLCSALSEEARGVEEGADGYLRKPVLYQDFMAALKDAGIDL